MMISEETFNSPQAGGAALYATLVLPLLLAVGVVLFDLSRVYLAVVFARQMALHTAKIAVATEPEGWAFETGQHVNLIYHPENEDSGITTRRQTFWQNQLDDQEPEYHGAPHYSEKERLVLNLAYGYARTMNPKMYFPIPDALNTSDPNADLHNRVNCSIYFTFASGSEPPSPFPVDDPSNDNDAYDQAIAVDRNRVFHVDCAVPTIGLRVLSFAFPEVISISRSAYAYQSGDLTP